MSHITDLADELATFEEHRVRLEREHFGRFVVVKGTDIIGLYDSCDTAARDAIAQFDKGSRFLLRQIGRNYAYLSPAATLGRIGAGPHTDPS